MRGSRAKTRPRVETGPRAPARLAPARLAPARLAPARLAPARLAPVRALTVAGFRRHTTYRGAQLSAAATDAVFGLLRSAVLLAALAGAGTTVGGYDRETAIAFAFLTQALIGPVEIFPWTELADRIRSGDVAVDLARPLSIQLQYACGDAGRALATLLPSAAPSLVVGTLAFGFFLPHRPWPYLLGAGSMLLAIAVSFGGRFLLNLIAFWVIEIRGMMRLYLLISMILSGLLLPVTWFPDWLRALAWCTPFPFLLQVPADLFAGRVTGWTALALLAAQAGWALALAAVGRLTLKAATRKLVVQGG